MIQLPNGTWVEPVKIEAKEREGKWEVRLYVGQSYEQEYVPCESKLHAEQVRDQLAQTANSVKTHHFRRGGE